MFSPQHSFAGAKPVRLPCGKCMSCRLTYAGAWMVRLVHERQLHELASFNTLTFSDDFLPENYSVDIYTMQLFMKRLRKKLGFPVRFFACGEYGEKDLRPHYHVLLFGTDFHADRYLWRRSDSGVLSYRSPTLESVWPFGHCETADFTKEAAGYTARYVTKKVGGDRAEAHYTRMHPVTGEIHRVKPEFVTMSSRPGIGSGWMDRFACDAFPSDFVVLDGKKFPVPRYYKKRLSDIEAQRVTAARKAAARRQADDNTDKRLMTRTESALLKAERLKREL